ncbi:wax ester/triacylglycerol synthase family O-acyltransferase [Rhodococcus aerolatus]
MSERMADLDVAWLHMERPDNAMVVNLLLTLERPLDLAAVRTWVAERVLPPFRRFRQRVEEPAVTFGPVSGPAWVDVDEVDLDAHLAERAVPAPGDDAALHRVVDELASRPLPTDRPLWELTLLTGHGDGCALLLRSHHALADGGALVQLVLTATEPPAGEERLPRLELADDRPPPPSVPGPVGRVLDRAADAARAVTATTATLGSPLLAALVGGDAARDLADLTASDTTMLAKLGVGMRPEPNLLQGPLTPAKRFGWTTAVPLADVVAVGKAGGFTLNTVVLGALTGALREYLRRHDGLVDEVVVICPVDLREKGAPMPAGLGNDFGLVFLPLPTGLTGARLHRRVVHERMGVIKHSREAAFIQGVLRTAGGLPARAQNAFIDTFAGRGTAVVTNVAGPPAVVELAGVAVRDILAWVPMTGPVGVGMSIVSYAGRLRVGLAADADLVPDFEDLLGLLDAALADVVAEA